DLSNLREAIGILQKHVASDARDYGAWWRIAKYDCYLARRLPDKQKKPIVEQGVTAGQRAEQLQPARPEGHYWTGVDEGLLAEARGLFGGLELIDSVRNEMETVLKMDPNYLEDGAERVLGRLYYLAPFFKGGNNQHSVRLLEHCLKLYPENSLTMLYLADSYRAVGRINDARRMLERVLHLLPPPDYGPELAENQAVARRELEKYFHASL
ncbi:MAG: tetratricopeptide repeat protein, partial [Terriglobia bacterium]